VRSGAFEEYGDEGGQKVFRLRWREETHTLNATELGHARFIRYLIRRGKLNEYRGTRTHEQPGL